MAIIFRFAIYWLQLHSDIPAIYKSINEHYDSHIIILFFYKDMNYDDTNKGF